MSGSELDIWKDFSCPWESKKDTANVLVSRGDGTRTVEQIPALDEKIKYYDLCNQGIKSIFYYYFISLYLTFPAVMFLRFSEYSPLENLPIVLAEVRTWCFSKELQLCCLVPNLYNVGYRESLDSHWNI